MFDLNDTAWTFKTSSIDIVIAADRRTSFEFLGFPIGLVI
jgi:hypothetical protein